MALKFTLKAQKALKTCQNGPKSSNLTQKWSKNRFFQNCQFWRFSVFYCSFLPPNVKNDKNDPFWQKHDFGNSAKTCFRPVEIYPQGQKTWKNRSFDKTRLQIATYREILIKNVCHFSIFDVFYTFEMSKMVQKRDFWPQNPKKTTFLTSKVL